MRTRGVIAVGALGVILLVTAAWWALALWPLSLDAPYWLARTRYVCFGAAADGLPSRAGWLVLVGEPLAMLGALIAVWGDDLRHGLRALGSRRWGRALATATAALGLIAVGAVVSRVRAAALRSDPTLDTTPLPGTYPRLDRAAPPFRLVDQRGDTVALEAFRGRPVLLTFAYAHCETVCPLLVREVLAARRRDPAVRAVALVVTLDPWRDVPSRLPQVASHWGLGEDELVLSGAVSDVEGTLDAWHVARARDRQTGVVSHPSVVYLIDRSGRIAYAAAGGAEVLAELLGRP